MLCTMHLARLFTFEPPMRRLGMRIRQALPLAITAKMVSERKRQEAVAGSKVGGNVESNKCLNSRDYSAHLPVRCRAWYKSCIVLVIVIWNKILILVVLIII